MREKVTKLVYKFYKTKGLEILLCGLMIKCISVFYIDHLLLQIQNTTIEIQQKILYSGLILPTTLKQLGGFILTLGIIKTTADIIIGLQNKLKEKKEVK